MNFALTPEQRQMQESLGEYLRSEGGIDLARAVMDGTDDVIPDLWSELAEMDYTALTVPPEHGGLGDGMVTLCVVLEEAGRVAMPGPYPETLAFGVPLVREYGSPELEQSLLPAVADGTCRLTYGVYEGQDPSLPEDITLSAEATEEGYRLSGTKTLVPYAGLADRVIIAARTRGGTSTSGVSLFVIKTDEAIRKPLDGLDRTRPVSQLTLDGVTVDRSAQLGPLHTGWEGLRLAMDRLNLAYCSMLVGGLTEAIDRSVEHGKSREQYGHPVGMFQAVKHRIADMWVDKELARGLVYYAAWALESDEPDSMRAVSAAKAFCGERCSRLFGDDIWNHGGMGFTWDHDAHIHLKQAKAWENMLGGAEEHLDRVADDLGF